MMKRIAQAWAFASILLLPNYIDLTASDGDARMRSPQPLTRIALAHLADMLVVAVLFACVMLLLRRLRTWPQIRWALLAILPAALFIRNLDVFPFDIPWYIVLSINLFWVGFVALLVARAPQAAKQLRLAGSSLLAGFALFALIMTWQLGRAVFWHPGPQAYSTPIAAAPANRPRLVWIVFDELAYKPVFEDRDPTLHLPNFDRLRRESTLYTGMTPIAYRTTRVIPSLMLGKSVTDVAYTQDNRYLVQFAHGSHWVRFNPQASLLGMARQKGLTSSIVGWYIAYCPIFQGIANQCYWGNDDAQDRGPTMVSASFAQDFWFPLRIMVEKLFAPRRAWADDARFNAEGHIASVQDVSRHALAAVADSQADILYLHLPAPHPPEFWNRYTHRFSVGGSYLDSLDYSDRLLGKILDRLQAQPRWSATTLIVQGDHSWRTHMWRPLPGWSAEDERISHGGQWDPRPVLMIHQPGQQSGATVSQPTSVMYVHNFVANYIEKATPSIDQATTSIVKAKASLAMAKPSVAQAKP